jgi:uncharacterized protein YqeY
MTALRARIDEATKAAMRARDKGRLAALRLVLAELKRLEVDERRALSEEDVVGVLNRMLKQRHDSETQFRNAGRLDLAEQEAFEIDLIREFMPAALTDAEVDALIERAIAESGASSARDLGKVMAILRGPAAGRADMAAVSARVKARLAG